MKKTYLLGGGIAVLTAAILAGCNGNDDDGTAAVAPAATQSVTITPSLGKILNAKVVARNAKTGAEIGSTFKDVALAPTMAAVKTAPAPTPVAAAVTLIDNAPDVQLPAVAAGIMPAMTGNFRKSSAQQSAQEMIRVSSELMEKLINLAGETSITRSRVEMGVHSFGQTVEEMGATVQRLVDQLRRMEGELEVQILASHTQEGGKYEDFDP